MAFIAENILGDRALQLGNEEFIRTLSIGSAWRFLRIGLRLAIYGTADIGATSTGTTILKFQIGLCSGTTYPFNSDNCLGYIGYRPNHLSGPFYSGGASNYYTWGTGANVIFQAIKKIGSVVTEIGASGGTQTRIKAGPDSYSLQVADFYRSPTDDTSYGVNPHWVGSGQVNANPSVYSLMRVMEDEGLATAYSTTYVTGGSGPYYQNGITVPLDTLSIVYNRSTPIIEIANICILRLY